MRNFRLEILCFSALRCKRGKNAAGARRGKCNRYKRLKNATSIKSKKYNQCHCNAKREIKRKAITKRWPDLNWSDSLCVRVKDRLLILLGTLSCKIFCFLLYCLVQLFCTQLFRTHPVWTFFLSRNGCHSLQPETFQFKENIQFNTTKSYCYTYRRLSFGFFESSDDCLSALMWSSGYWSTENQTARSVGKGPPCPTPDLGIYDLPV